ncbi:hypothetical protein [Hyunsoonleella ulvae]|uniref:hypothetical protein n=1 Tax=Hyunsoonleella ulvae TaxID=2799948 RepID=UPI00193A2483|nr:hypothetical protein [Hyunsoonleella ulvae]
MKAKHTLTLLACITYFVGFSQQNTNYRYTKNQEAAANLISAFNTMHKTQNIVNWKDTKPCKVKDLMGKVPTSIIAIDTSNIAFAINGIYSTIQPPITSETFDKGMFNTLEDKALNAINNSKNFADFVHGFTGKDIGGIKGERTSSSGMVYKDIDEIRSYYKSLKKFLDGLEFTPKHDNDLNGNCRTEATSDVKIIKFNYPKITWKISTYVTVNCICNNGLDPTEVKSGSYEYTGTLNGIFTHAKMTFDQPKDSKITIHSLECCAIKEEPISSEPLTDSIDDLMPEQYIGGGVGIGAQQDFEEISYCVSAEYLKKLTYGSDENAWYVGAEVGYSGWSFNDSKSNRIKIGPKLQYHTAVTPSKQTQLVVGLMGNYNFGTNDNGFSKDDVTGIVGCAYGGVNIRVCENWSLFGQFPVFIYESTTFKSEAGGEFKTDGTSLLLNKDNPLKLGVRYKF